MVVREALVTPGQDLLTLVAIGGVTANMIANSGEAGEGKSGGKHC